jgi:hypothetical protein
LASSPGSARAIRSRSSVAGDVDVADVLAVGEQPQCLLLGKEHPDVAAGLGVGAVDAGQRHVQDALGGHQHLGVRADAELAQPGGAGVEGDLAGPGRAGARLEGELLADLLLRRQVGQSQAGRAAALDRLSVRAEQHDRAGDAGLDLAHAGYRAQPVQVGQRNPAAGLLRCRDPDVDVLGDVVEDAVEGALQGVGEDEGARHEGGAEHHRQHGQGEPDLVRGQVAQ